MITIDIDEALRYAGVRIPDAAMRAQMCGIADRLQQQIQTRYTWKLFALQHTEQGFQLGGTGILLSGGTAEKMLRGCTEAVLLVCSLGASFDALLRTVEKQSMADAVLTDACGSAMVEAVCNAAEQEIAARCAGRYLTDRFSPGYGDLPLSLQPAILQATDSLRRVGVTVTPSCLMNPSKSVTAVIGLSDTPQPAKIRGCVYCSMQNTCQFRKRGQTCA